MFGLCVCVSCLCFVHIYVAKCCLTLCGLTAFEPRHHYETRCPNYVWDKARSLDSQNFPPKWKPGGHLTCTPMAVHETLKRYAETQRKQPSRCLRCVSFERLKWAEARRRTNDVLTVVRNIMVKHSRNMPNTVSAWTSGFPTGDRRWYRNNLHISNETQTPNTNTQTKHHLYFWTSLKKLRCYITCVSNDLFNMWLMVCYLWTSKFIKTANCPYGCTSSFRKNDIVVKNKSHW